MSIIGYDGRLRPANRAAQANNPNEFDPNAVAKIGDAQPKFAELAMKAIDSIGGDLTKYGNAAAQKQKRLDALADDEAQMGVRETLSRVSRDVKNRDDLTPEQKVQSVNSVAKWIAPESTGNEERDRRNTLFMRGALLREVEEIQRYADATEKAAKKAVFDGELSVQQVGVMAAFDEQLPVMVATAKSINELPERIREFASGVFAKGEGLTPEQEAAFNNVYYSTVSSMIRKAGVEFNKRKTKEAQEALVTQTSAASLGAENIQAAVAYGKDALNKPEASVFFTERALRENINAVGINYSVNNANKAITSMNTKADAMQKNATILVRQGNTGAYDREVMKINAEVVRGFDEVLTELKADKGFLLADIDADTTIDDETKKNFKAIIAEKYDAIIRETEKKKVAAIETVKKVSASESKKVGEDVHKQIKDFLKNPTNTPTSQLAFDAIQLMTPSKEYVESYAATEIGNDKIAERVAEKRYPEATKGDARLFLAQDYMNAIADIDFSNGGFGNVVRLKEILTSAVSVFGFRSDEYSRIASFARSNFLSEKDGESAKQVESRLAKALFGSNDKKVIDALSDEDHRRYNKLKMELSEVPHEMFEDAFSLSVNRWKSGKLYDKILSTDEVHLQRKQVLLAPEVVSEVYREYERPSTEIENLDAQAKEVTKKYIKDAIASGMAPRVAVRQSAWADGSFWLNEAKKRNIKVWGNHPSEAERLVKQHIEREEQRRKDDEARKKKEEQDAKDMPGLLQWLKDNELPTNRSAYTSAFGIGGHPINRSDELELGINWDSKEELSADEIRKIKSQFEAFEREKLNTLKQFEQYNFTK